jgi:hypothetical protein
MASIPASQWNPPQWADNNRWVVLRGRRRVNQRQHEARERLLDEMYELAVATGPKFFQRGRHPDNAAQLRLNYWSYRWYLKFLMQKYPQLATLRRKGLRLPYRKSAEGTFRTPMIPARIRRAEQATKRRHLLVK